MINHSPTTYTNPKKDKILPEEEWFLFYLTFLDGKDTRYYCTSSAT